LIGNIPEIKPTRSPEHGRLSSDTFVHNNHPQGVSSASETAHDGSAATLHDDAGTPPVIPVYPNITEGASSESCAKIPELLNLDRSNRLQDVAGHHYSY